MKNGAMVTLAIGFLLGAYGFYKILFDFAHTGWRHYVVWLLGMALVGVAVALLKMAED